MTTQLAPHLQADKKRLVVMAIVNVVAIVTAISAIVVYFKLALPWALAVFVAAMLAGFGAQIWFIAGFRRKGA